MKKTILFLVFLLTAVLAEAQKSVGYVHNILAPGECEVTYSVVSQGSDYSIIVRISSEKLVFVDNPKMMVRTFDDEVLTLEGSCINNSTTTSGIIISNIFFPESEIHTLAQFAVTPEQFEILRHGVAKIRLTMAPMNHDKTFRRDVIGEALYKLYLKEKANAEDF